MGAAGAADISADLIVKVQGEIVADINAAIDACGKLGADVSLSFSDGLAIAAEVAAILQVSA